jgi:hypothetical protein
MNLASPAIAPSMSVEAKPSRYIMGSIDRYAKRAFDGRPFSTNGRSVFVASEGNKRKVATELNFPKQR